MCATSEPGAVVIGMVGVAPRATTIHAGTAIAIAAAATATYVPLGRLVRRHVSIRVRNAAMRFFKAAKVMRNALRKRSSEDLHVVRTSGSIDGVTGAHLSEGRVEDVGPMTT